MSRLIPKTALPCRQYPKTP